MWYDDPIKEYADISYTINKKYCDSNGYDLIYSCKRNLPDRHQAWERFPMLLEILNEDRYDYVMWIDADACFNIDCDTSLETVISLSNNKDILLSSDNNLDPNIPINTGVMILKNTIFAKQFLSKVINSENIEQCRSKFNKRLWEQDCVTYLFNNNAEMKGRSVIYEYGILQLFTPDININTACDPIVFHYMSLPHSERISKLKKKLNNIL